MCKYIERKFPESRVIHITVGDAVRIRIFELCDERNISINKLCGQSGITQSTVNNIVNKRNKSTTISTVKKICDGLDITIEEFFDSAVFCDLEPEIK